MSRLVALAAVLVALAAAPAGALAQDNPFLPPLQQQQTPSQQPSTPPTPAPVEERDDGDGTGPGLTIAIAAITVALIGGIWFAITRDARRATRDRRNKVHTARTEPDAFERATPGSRGRHHTKATTRRKPSKQEQKRRKRGRAR